MNIRVPRNLDTHHLIYMKLGDVFCYRTMSMTRYPKYIFIPLRQGAFNLTGDSNSLNIEPLHSYGKSHYPYRY
jgi:hypothetical protein